MLTSPARLSVARQDLAASMRESRVIFERGQAGSARHRKAQTRQVRPRLGSAQRYAVDFDATLLVERAHEFEQGLFVLAPDHRIGQRLEEMARVQDRVEPVERDVSFG